VTRIYCFSITLMLIVLLQGCPKDDRQTETKSASGNIIISMPHPNDQISSPVKVAGKARVFEAALTVRVLSEDGKELGKANIMASQGAPEFGDFSVQVNFKKPANVSTGFVEAYSESAKDGSHINVVRVPVRFK
jgi:hypothetical protein